MRAPRSESAVRRLPSTGEIEAHASRNAIVRACARVADSLYFNGFIFALIVLNAAVLGLETYEQVARDHGDALGLVNDAILAVFVVELAIRFVAHGVSPRRFLSSGWNVFDLVVVSASFLPGLRENATLLRLARLARIARIVRLLPDLRIIVLAIGRSLPGVASLAVLTIVLIYVYGMLGWVIFGDVLPEDYGTIGSAALTMFVLLSLENLPDYIDAGVEAAGGLSVLFFISYVLIASFLLFNFLIGVIINSMEEARALEKERDAEERAEHGLPPAEPTLLAQARELRELAEQLERQVRASERLDRARGGG